MKSILEELFYGNICPNTDCRGNDEQTKELIFPKSISLSKYDCKRKGAISRAL